MATDKTPDTLKVICPKCGGKLNRFELTGYPNENISVGHKCKLCHYIVGGLWDGCTLVGLR